MDLRYMDATGFSLTSSIPYAWQRIGKTIEIEVSHSRRLNVVGFMNTDNTLQAYTIEESITSQVIITFIDDFARDLKERTVLAIDNASIHTSQAFKDKIPEWKTKNLEIFYLPKYSPELNLIEILWRFIKYEWIEFSAYKSWEDLVQYVEKTIVNFGTEYKINFV